MGIDYVLDVDCPAKQRLGVEGIVNMVKARSRAEMMIRFLNTLAFAASEEVEVLIDG